MPVVLTEQQLAAIQALDWLLDDSRDSRMTGRTVAVAVTILRKALRNPERRVTVFGHHDTVGEAQRVLDLIRELVEMEPSLFDRNFEITSTSITYQGEPIPDWWPERMYSPKPPRDTRHTLWERLGQDE